MKKCRITVMRRAEHRDLMEEYENPISSPCDMILGDEYIVNGTRMPTGFCVYAWEILFPFVKELARGGGNFFDGWMKNEKSAMVSCNDGF